MRDQIENMQVQNTEDQVQEQAAATSAAVSGLYRRRQPPVFEGLRLDVDGPYPQSVASGNINVGMGSRVHWIANLAPTGANTWAGGIWYKEGDVASFPYTAVKVKAERSAAPASRRARVTFSASGLADRIRTYRFESRYFHPVDFEFDSAEGEAPTVSIDTGAHSNRPASLPVEDLTIQKAFRRAGFDVTTSPGGTGQVPIIGAGPNALWSDNEMHDTMQIFWSRFADVPQWAMWVFFASLHESGTSLGGIMFDDIGLQHRQGTAIFNDSFIANAPTGDPNPTAWVQRMIFWTACHEMGHGFNLAHSWQKSLGTPWIPLADEPEARSFMNYPFNVAGGQASFFADFGFRFSDGELLFMRHAPHRFVRMGDALWFDHHGFEGANVLPAPTFKLEIRVNREEAIFEFLEPVVPELKLTNASSQPQLIDEHLLSASDSLTVIIKKQGQQARQFAPYAQYCFLPNQTVLMPGESIYESLFISAGINGWDIAEPGNYIAQVALRVNGEDIISNPLYLRIAPPRSYDEELIAQEFFSEEVGRILTFDGSRSRVLESGNDALRETVDRLSDHPVALHASVALGSVLASEYKLLAEDPAAKTNWKIRVDPPKPEEAKDLLSTALIDKPKVAAASLGHIDYKWYVDRASEKLAKLGATDTAADFQHTLYDTMSTRKVHGRKVLDRVLREIEAQRDSYRAKTGTKGRKSKAKK